MIFSKKTMEKKKQNLVLTPDEKFLLINGEPYFINKAPNKEILIHNKFIRKIYSPYNFELIGVVFSDYDYNFEDESKTPSFLKFMLKSNATLNNVSDNTILCDKIEVHKDGNYVKINDNFTLHSDVILIHPHIS